MTPEEELEALKNWPDEDVCKLIDSRVRQLRLEGEHTQETLAALADVLLRTFKRLGQMGKLP
jgi:DNA-binding XRE family transcriptional regulator